MMQNFCEKMEDRLLSHALFSEALNIMQEFKVGEATHIQRMLQKIDSLRYYY